MRRLGVSVAGAILALGSLAACGDDDSDSDSGSGGEDTSSDSGDYCSIIEEAEAEFGGEDAGMDQETLDATLDAASEAAEAAPDDEVKEAWETQLEVFDSLQTKLDEYELSFDDLQPDSDAMRKMDPEARQELGAELQEISGNPDLVDAQKVVQTSAKEDCDITMGDDTAGN